MVEATSIVVIVLGHFLCLQEKSRLRELMMTLLLLLFLCSAEDVSLENEKKRADFLNMTTNNKSRNIQIIESFGNTVHSSHRNRVRRWVSNKKEKVPASSQPFLQMLLRSTDDSFRPRFSLHHKRTSKRKRRMPAAVDAPVADLNPAHRRNPNSHLSANISVKNNEEEGKDMIENWLKVLIEGDINSDIGMKATESEAEKNKPFTHEPTVRTSQWITHSPTQTTTLPGLRDVSPFYPCDRWDNHSRTCWSLRAIGDSITFCLALDKEMSIPHSYQVLWTKHYHIRHTSHFVIERINPDEPPWNMAVGKRGLELRVSPITDDDFDSNKFVASVWKVLPHPKHQIKRFVKKVNFKMEITPVDLGYVYIGEHITINIDGYATIPPDSMIFDWQLEDEGGSLDIHSNMVVSRTRRILHIKELRKQQEGFISCRVFTNIGVFVSKRRFFVHELNNEMLTGNKNQDDVVISASESRIRRDSLEDPFYEDLYEPEDDSSLPKRGSPEGMWSGVNNNALSQKFTEFHNRIPSQMGKYLEHGSHDFKTLTNTSPHKPVKHPMSSLTDGSSDFKNFGKIPDEIAPVMENYAILQKSSLQNHNHPSQKDFHFSEFKPNFIEDDGDGKYSPSKPVAGQGESIVETDLLLFHLNSDDESIQTDIKESHLVSRCSTDRQCSNHANCVQPKSNQPGHCECSHGYRGNGVFCWEHMDFMPPLEAPVIPEQKYPSPGETGFLLSEEKMPVTQSADSSWKNSLVTQRFLLEDRPFVNDSPQSSQSREQSILSGQQIPQPVQELHGIHSKPLVYQQIGDSQHQEEPMIASHNQNYEHRQEELPLHVQTHASDVIQSGLQEILD